MSSSVRVLFRTGGGRQIGLGHVRRCLSLAMAIQAANAECTFLLHGDREVAGLVADAGFRAIHLESETDDAGELNVLVRRHQIRVIVVDGYSFRSQYFRGLAETGAAMVAIDDLAEQELPVDLIVNGAAGAARLAYRGLPHTRYLLGPQYALLRPEFAEAPSREIAERVRRVLITVGGSDPHNLTPRLMRWTWEALGNVTLDVLVGPLFGNLHEIETAAKREGCAVTLHHNPRNVHSLMLATDLALSSGGQTLYELAATGAPTVGVRLADNQTTNLRGLSEAGALVWVGDARDAGVEENVRRVLSGLAADPKRRAALSEHGRATVDARGADRVAHAIVELVGGSR